MCAWHNDRPRPVAAALVIRVVESVRAGIQRIRSSQQLLFAFLDKTGLSF
jgi:hypothetical protein